MVGRTVVIGDIPWVAQCAEAFLSKVGSSNSQIVGDASCEILVLRDFIESSLLVPTVLQVLMF